MNCRKCGVALPPAAIYCHMCGVRQEKPPHSPKKRGNGQGTVVKLKNGKYLAKVVIGYYTDEDGRRRCKTASKTFVRRTDAIQYLPILKQRHEKPADATLADLRALYIKSKEYISLSSSQQDKLGYAWKRLEPLHLRGIATLTVDDMQSTIDGAVSTYYPARDMKVMLSHLYAIAIRKEICPYNKSDYIDLPPSPSAKRECWTQEEVAAMWKDYESHPFTGYLLIMCYCGLRYGELSTILLGNIHLEQNFMTGGIKSEAGRRDIPISQRIKPVVATMMAGRKRKLLEMNEDNFYAAYWDVIDRRLALRHLVPHTCRHYYFTALTAAGVQGGIIAEVGGHADYSTTMKNYVSIPLKDKIRAVNKIK